LQGRKQGAEQNIEPRREKVKEHGENYKKEAS
jgi:hypothetical protein